MSAQTQVFDLLRQYSAVLIRQRKHCVYRVRGRIFVVPSTPSDTHAWRNCLADLRKILGLCGADRGRPGVRRAKHGCQPNRMVRFTFSSSTASLPSLRQQLQRVMV